MQGYSRPDLIDICLANLMLAQEITCRVGTVNFETFIAAAMIVGQPHIVEHTADIQQLVIDLKLALLTGQCSQ